MSFYYVLFYLAALPCKDKLKAERSHMKKHFAAVLFICGLSAPLVPVSMTIAAPIDQEVANSYNDGIVRCANEECARYLYACFRSYSAGPLLEFLNCGSHAARLNDNKAVVPPA